MNIFKGEGMIEEIRLSWFGKISFTSLIILLILLLGATMGIIIGSKTRIKQLEDRIVKLEAMEYRLTQIWEQAKSFDQFKNRLDKLEVSLSKTDHLIKAPLSLPKKIADKTPQKIENSIHSKAPPKIAKKRYHKVTSGETLYSICRRYGLPVEKVRILNKLNEVSVIQPGQRLLLNL
jgi:LysM repeat protein